MSNNSYKAETWVDFGTTNSRLLARLCDDDCGWTLTFLAVKTSVTHPAFSIPKAVILIVIPILDDDDVSEDDWISPECEFGCDPFPCGWLPGCISTSAGSDMHGEVYSVVLFRNVDYNSPFTCLLVVNTVIISVCK